MEHAKTILFQPRATTLEIVLEVGTVNAQHFERKFKQAHGRTPSQTKSIERT